MQHRLILVGAGGHGKVIADIARHRGYSRIAFLDDGHTGTHMGYPILGGSSCLQELNDGSTDFVIAVGSNAFRRQLAERWDVNWVTLIHPTAQLGADVSIGRGTVVMAGVVVNPCAVIGEHCILNTGCIVEHDNCIGNYVHISPNAALGGTVTVGDGTHIGIGSTVRNNIRIAGGCTIGAGAVVVSDLTEAGTYIGVPARAMQAKA